MHGATACGPRGAGRGPGQDLVTAVVRHQESLLEFSQGHTGLSLGAWVTLTSAWERGWCRGNLFTQAWS